MRNKIKGALNVILSEKNINFYKFYPCKIKFYKIAVFRTLKMINNCMDHTNLEDFYLSRDLISTGSEINKDCVEGDSGHRNRAEFLRQE